MRSLAGDATRVSVDGAPFDLAPDDATGRADAGHERVAYVPAQRVMSIRDGLTRPFGEYRAGDPYVLRAFSADVHDVVQKELSADGPIFPRPQRFNEPLRNVIATNVLAEWELRVEAGGLEKRFVLVDPNTHTPAPLPFLTWSAGQREFVPLRLGLYRQMPAGSRPRRGRLEWVVIEEPEMGLHPHAIAATMAFVLELLRRRYRVVLSTHATQVLDVVWGLRRLQGCGASRAAALVGTTSCACSASRASAAFGARPSGPSRRPSPRTTSSAGCPRGTSRISTPSRTTTPRPAGAG